MKIKILLALQVLIFSNLPAQNQNVSCTEDSLYQALDFWVGEWTVYDSTEMQVQGHNTIAKVLASCAVTEDWQGASGGTGKSLFYVDNATKTWKQVWVTTSAKAPWGQKEKQMVYLKPGKQAIFQGQYEVQPQVWLLDRTILTKLSEKKVRQEIQVSSDGGQHWRTSFLGIYIRK